MRATRVRWLWALVGAGCVGPGAGTGATSESPGETSSGDPSGSAATSASTGQASGPTTGGPGGDSTGAATTAVTGETGTTTGEASATTTTNSTATGASTGDPTGDGAACDGEVHAGEATYYAADGSGNCSFPADPGDPMVAAMNHTDFMASAACGACVRVEGPDGTITVKIVDRCPECPEGNIDLSQGAFAMIAPLELGKVPISWRYVSCDTQGPIVYHFKEGSNQWWTAVQIRGHRNPVASFEYKDMMGQWKAVPRVDYNYFIDEAGMGPGPYAFRVTDVDGNVLEDAGVPFVEAGDSPGAGQFPPCTP